MNGYPLFSSIDRLGSPNVMRGDQAANDHAMIPGVDRLGNPVVIPVSTGVEDSELRAVSDRTGNPVAVGLSRQEEAGYPYFIMGASGDVYVPTIYADSWKVNAASDGFDRADGPITSGGNWQPAASYMIYDNKCYRSGGNYPIWQAITYYPCFGTIDCKQTVTSTLFPAQSWLWRIGVASGGGAVAESYGEVLLYTVSGFNELRYQMALLFGAGTRTTSTPAVVTDITLADIPDYIEGKKFSWRASFSGSCRVSFGELSFSHQF